MNIPKTVKVGGHVIVVEFVDTLNDGKLAGQFLYRNIKILLAKRVRHSADEELLDEVAPKILEVTFLHELLHAVDFIYNTYGSSEKTIDHFSEGWFQVIEDNPDMFRTERGNNENKSC